MTDALGLDVEVTLEVKLDCRVLDEAAQAREVEASGFRLVDEAREGYLHVANHGEKPTVIPDDLLYLVQKVCFEAISDVLERDHCHIDNFGFMGSMDLVREEELTLIGGAEFEANYFPTDALMIALYRCGGRFMRLLERAEAVAGRPRGYGPHLVEQERAAGRVLAKHGLL